MLKIIKKFFRNISNESLPDWWSEDDTGMYLGDADDDEWNIVTIEPSRYPLGDVVEEEPNE